MLLFILYLSTLFYISHSIECFEIYPCRKTLDGRYLLDTLEEFHVYVKNQHDIETVKLTRHLAEQLTSATYFLDENYKFPDYMYFYTRFAAGKSIQTTLTDYIRKQHPTKYVKFKKRIMELYLYYKSDKQMPYFNTPT